MMAIQIKDIPLFKDLSGDELAQAGECLIEKSFKKGETLFMEGSACERVFIVREGRVRVFRGSSAGREQTLETLGPGDTCACHPGPEKQNCSSSATAMTPCRVWYLSREHFARLVRSNQKVSQALLRIFSQKLRCFGALIEDISLKNTKQRLIKFLLDAGSGPDGLSMTREEIAQRTGMVRETVARHLAELKSAHLVALEARRIVLLNKAGLGRLLQ
jgi:CRP/FNR family transcriptional regulator